MKSPIALLAAALLLAACSPAATTPAPAAAGTQTDSFEAALAAAHLTKLELKPVERTQTHELPSAPVVAGRRITMIVTGGYHAESLEFARDASNRVVRVLRKPIETVKETVVEGCETHVFAGGRAWFERVVIELPEGTTWGGEVSVKYPAVREVVRYTNKTPDGKPCPPPAMMID